MSLGFEDCKVFVSTVDSQSSAENGIVVQVVGELSNKGGPWRKFAQTFFLAEQPNGYFVSNDIFRYIKEESDDEDSASNAGGAGAAEDAATSSSAPTAPADVLATLDQPIGQHAHHDFELASGHGAPGDAAGVTVVPPMDQQADSDARANLNELVNGHASQEHVVELHDEINDEQPEQAGHAIAHQQAVEEEAVPEPEQSQPAVEESVQESAAPEPVAEPEPQQVQEPEPAPAASTSASAPSSSAPASQPNAPAPQAAAPAPSKPSAPKSWASLAATNTDKWKGQVVSETRGISSSKPTSKVNSGASTPAAAAAAASRGPTPAAASASAAPAAPASEKGSNDGFITAGPRERKNNYNNAEHQQGESSSHDNARTRTPHFNNNVETGYSIVVTGVTQSIGHAMLRQRLSDEFAKVHEPNRRKEWAKLSYLDIDRSKETAYVDFEAEWAMKKAIEAGQANVDGTMLTITAGKGRRDVSAINRGQQQGGNAGRGGGRGGAQQGQGRGGAQTGRGASNAQRGGGAGRTPSGRGQ